MPRAEAAVSRLHPNPQEAGSLAVVEVIKHPDNRWQVLHVEVSNEHRRRGIATMLYDRVQFALRTTLYPSGWLSDDAYRFWHNRGCHFLQWYRQVDCFKGMWISPKALLTLRDIAVAKMMDWSEDAKAS
jgi:hypothetical protein